MTSAVVVGGGVIGLCTSLALARRGLNVTLIEAGTPGTGASAANAGWVTPSLSGPLPAPGLLGTSLRWLLRPDSPLWIRPRLDPGFAHWLWRFWRQMTPRAYHAGLEAMLELSSRAIALFDELAEAGLRFEMHDDGVLLAYSSMRAYDAGLREIRELAPYGYAPLQTATGGAVRDLEPALGDGITGAFVVRGERHVDPVAFCAALIGELDRCGVVVAASTPATGFRVRGSVVTAVVTGETAAAADVVVIAAGVGSAALGRQLRFPLPIESGKGYAVDLEPAPITLRRPVYLHDQRVAATPLTSRLRLAGTMELGGRGDAISTTRVRAIESGARRLLAGWPDAPVSTSYLSGHRPMTPDGLPAIGPLPGWSNVWIATGHAMMGLTLGPATAEVVADGIVTGQVPAVLRPFLPDRFARRSRH